MRKRKTSCNAKVASELEVLQKPERLITRYFQEARHTEEIIGAKEESEEKEVWKKYAKDRMKTVSVALVFCLHIGIDPPDMGPKPENHARLEGWIDPFACHPSRAIVKITQSVQKSYERWQPRARYKVASDPTAEDVRKLCLSMRRNAKDERVLFHYNGHGVPKPTPSGEIWVFNKTFTQYIPLSIFDLQAWMEWPTIYVWDCSSAETIINSFNRFTEDHDKEWFKEFQNHQESTGHPLPVITSNMDVEEQAAALRFKKRPKYQNCIQLAACRVNERLPMTPGLPADLFTSCLTTPIQTSLLWYIIRTGRRQDFSNKFIEEIPGTIGDRKTLLGELNWIFTAITDTIAWSTLPKEDFQRLFRQDLLLASLFRSFILAEKIMGENGCGVVSSPALPSTSDHPLWESWEYILDLTVNHMYNRLVLSRVENVHKVGGKASDLIFAGSLFVPLDSLTDYSALLDEAIETQHNWFFVEQLRAFEVWLDYGSERHKPPMQLPIVLQVLLSQAHRLRALELLSRFLDLGQWAVVHALSVGIFPYVQKLLQSHSRELRQWLGFIWAKILAVDPSCQTELFKENGDERIDNHKPKAPLRYYYFIQIMNDPETTTRQKIVPAFILAMLFHNNYRTAQENLTEKGYVNLCTELLGECKKEQCRLLKLWILIGLGRLWADFNEARWQAIRLGAYNKVVEELEDVTPDVRAAAVYALGCLIKNSSQDNEHASTVDQELCDELCQKCTLDGSVLVRVELVVAIQWFVMDFEQRFAAMLLNIAEPLNIDLRTRDMNPHRDLQDIASFVKYNSVEVDPGRMTIWQKRNELLFEEVILEEIEANDDPDNRRFGINDWLRYRCLRQIRYLETKNFYEPLEKIWLSLLRLAVDPSLRVANMAQVLVRKIESAAVDRINKVDTQVTNIISKNENDHPMVAEAKNVVFEVGSPTASLVRDSCDTPLAPPQRKTSAAGTPKHKTRMAKEDLLSMVRPSQSFTPKRVTTGRLDWTARDKKSASSQEPLVQSDFVDWCSRVFVEPILDFVQSNECEDYEADRLLIRVNPTDWAYHTKEGLEQVAIEEFKKPGPCDTSLGTLAIKRVRQLVMSSLRKIIYCSDGRNVSLARYDGSNISVIRKFAFDGGNSFGRDTITSLLVINDMSREMLLCGSDRGVLRIWDPMFNIHSHDLEAQPHFVTSSPILRDQIRNMVDKHEKFFCRYDWCQDQGRVVASGNMKVVRIWDAQYEKTIQDVIVDSKCGSVKALSADLGHSDLIAVGFSKGPVDVHDLRLPSRSSRIMRYEDTTSPVVHCTVRSKLDSSCLMLCASEAGEVATFDVRMFVDPIRELKIDVDRVINADVHQNSQMFGLICKNGNRTEGKLFDIKGSPMGVVNSYPPNNLFCNASVLSFHKMRCLVAIADENSVSLYGKKAMKI
ncbi:unnamed protein product [Auanema sp. JU1783]|nr:unnamed protein product [Auanema sp. JU1783]